MAVRTRAQLKADADGSLPDNVIGLVKPEHVRSRVKDLADSALLAEDVGSAAGKNVGTGANDVASGNHTHGAATSTAPGFMSAGDKAKLDGIAAGADKTPALGTAAALNAGSAAGNVPVLDASGKLAESTLPAIAITETSVVASQSAMLALVAQTGDIAVRSDINKTFALAAMPASTLANWIELRAPTDAVLSVAGKTGAVTLAKGDVGLGNVDNTPDADKPISTAAQAALNGKANTSHTHPTAQVTGLDTALADKAATDLSNVTQVAARTKVGTGTMAYRDVTISTADPSGGVDGQVWLKV